MAALLLGLAALGASMAACVAVRRTLDGAWIVAAVAATGAVAAMPLLWGGGGAAALGARPDPRAARGLGWIAVGAALAALPGTAACAVVAHSAAAAGDNVVKVLYEQGAPWTWLAVGPGALSLAVFAAWWRGGRTLAGGEGPPAEPAWRRRLRRSVPVVVVAASGAALLAAPPRAPAEALSDPTVAAATVASDASVGGRAYKWLHAWHQGSVLAPIVFVGAIPPAGLSPAHGYAPRRHVALDSPRTLAALRTLRLAGPAARPAVPALCRLLARGDEAERQAVLRALLEIRPSGNPALAALDREWRREPGAWTDGQGPELLAAATDIVDPFHAEIVLVDALGSPAGAIREAAWEQLRMSLSRKPAPHVHHPAWLPALLDAVDRPGPGRDAGVALVRLLQEPPDLCALEVDALLAACEHDDLRAWALFGLDRRGSHAARALPAVRRALADPDPAVRRAAIAALQSLAAPAEAVAVLRRMAADDSDPDLRAAATGMLEEHGG